MDGSFSKDPMRCVLCNTGRWFWFFAFRVPFLALAVCSLLSLSFAFSLSKSPTLFSIKHTRFIQHRQLPHFSLSLSHPLRIIRNAFFLSNSPRETFRSSFPSHLHLLSFSSPLLSLFDCHFDIKLTPPPPKRFVLHSHLPHFSTTLVLQFSHRSHFPISSKSIPISPINFPPLKFNLFFFFPRFQIQIQERKKKTHIDILVFFFVSMIWLNQQWLVVATKTKQQQQQQRKTSHVYTN